MIAQTDRPAVVQIKVLFPGGEAWQDRLVLRWTDRGGHPVVKEGNGELIIAPGEWRPC
jgi:hypothetical protein